MAEKAFEQALRDALAEFGVTADAEAIRRFTVHYELLVEWNRNLNLTRITEPEDAARFHFAESAFAAQFLDPALERVLDVGTGGGFPGLPMAALFRDRRFVLVESASKKCVFLREAVAAIGAENVEVVNGRFEPGMASAGDGIVARAVDRFAALLPVLFRAPARQFLLFGSEDLLDEADRLSRREGRRVPIPGFDRRRLGLYGGKRFT